MGDYFDMVSDNAGAHLAWTNTFNGEQDVYYSHITPNVANGIIEYSGNFNISIFPNPTNGKFQISNETSNVDIEIFNVVGVKVFSISINQKIYEVPQILNVGLPRMISRHPNSSFKLKVFSSLKLDFRIRASSSVLRLPV